MAEKSYHHGDLRLRLVNASRALLERDGFDALSIRACAREAGVSHSAPLHHFKNMGELTAAVAASGFWDFVQSLGTAADRKTDPRERLIEMGRAYVAFGAANPGLYRCMFGDHKPNNYNEDLNDASTAAWLQLLTAVSQVANTGDAEQNALLIWSVTHGQTMLKISGSLPDDIDSDRAIVASFQTVIAGITSTSQDLPS